MWHYVNTYTRIENVNSGSEVNDDDDDDDNL
jgi:hypothetical protein